MNLREPIKVINKLSENGWTLVTVTQVSSDKENRPNSPFILYYFRKVFELQLLKLQTLVTFKSKITNI